MVGGVKRRLVCYRAVGLNREAVAAGDHMIDRPGMIFAWHFSLPFSACGFHGISVNGAYIVFFSRKIIKVRDILRLTHVGEYAALYGAIHVSDAENRATVLLCEPLHQSDKLSCVIGTDVFMLLVCEKCDLTEALCNSLLFLFRLKSAHKPEMRITNAEYLTVWAL